MNENENVLNKLAELWSLYPEYRFGQLISNLLDDEEVGAGLFYIKDEELLRLIEKEKERAYAS